MKLSKNQRELILAMQANTDKYGFDVISFFGHQYLVALNAVSSLIDRGIIEKIETSNLKLRLTEAGHMINIIKE